MQSHLTAGDWSGSARELAIKCDCYFLLGGHCISDPDLLGKVLPMSPSSMLPRSRIARAGPALVSLGPFDEFCKILHYRLLNGLAIFFNIHAVRNLLA